VAVSPEFMRIGARGTRKKWETVIPEYRLRENRVLALVEIKSTCLISGLPLLRGPGFYKKSRSTAIRSVGERSVRGESHCKC
jgi:hypothetical protein